MCSFLKHSLLSPDLVAALVEEEGGQLVALVVLLLQLLAGQCHLATKMELELVDKAVEGKMKLDLKYLKVELLCRLQPLCDLFQIALFFSKCKSAPNFTNLKGQN